MPNLGQSRYPPQVFSVNKIFECFNEIYKHQHKSAKSVKTIPVHLAVCIKQTKAANRIPDFIIS